MGSLPGPGGLWWTQCPAWPSGALCRQARAGQACLPGLGWVSVPPFPSVPLLRGAVIQLGADGKRVINAVLCCSVAGGLKPASRDGCLKMQILMGRLGGSVG